MAAQRKYPDELRERAVKMVFEIRGGTGKGMGSWPGGIRAPLICRYGLHPGCFDRSLSPA